jgi:hypothetical protein
MAQLRDINFDNLKKFVIEFSNQEHCNCNLKEDDLVLLPHVKSDGTIVFSKRLSTALMLFTAYIYEPDRLHEKLFLYLLASQHAENGNWGNVKLVLNELDDLMRNQFGFLYKFPHDVSFYLDYQAEAMLAHEFGHYIYQLHPERLDQNITEIKDYVLSSNPGGIHGFLGKIGIMKVLNDKHMMEELSCDSFAMAFVSKRLKHANDDTICPEHVLRQIIRLFVSLRYLNDVQPPNGVHLFREMKKNYFDIMRATIISYQLNKDWDCVTATMLREEFAQYQHNRNAARKRLMNTLKYHHIRKIQSSYSTMSTNERNQIKERLLKKDNELMSDLRFSPSILDYSFDNDEDDDI